MSDERPSPEMQSIKTDVSMATAVFVLIVVPIILIRSIYDLVVWIASF